MTPTIVLLRNRMTGLYSPGGFGRPFVPFRRAKVWRSAADFRNYLKSLIKYIGGLPIEEQHHIYSNLMPPELDVLEFNLICPTKIHKLSNYPLPRSFNGSAFLTVGERKLA